MSKWLERYISKRSISEKPVLFSEFYTTGGKSESACKPIPLSARTCKTYPGLELDLDDKNKKHGTRDILISATVIKKLRLIDIPAILSDCSIVIGNCKCKQPMKEINGFYLGDEKIEISSRMHTKVALNRARMVSSEVNFILMN